MDRLAKTGAWIVVALLLGAACGVFLWEPWHGPVVLWLSARHGVDAGDLPALLLVALAVTLAHGQVPPARTAGPWRAGRRVGAVSAVVLGALLVSVVDTAGGSSLVPAGGGTFGGSTLHADARRAEPVGRWTHVAVTYDGAALRLYVDGPRCRAERSRHLLGTTDPLWIGGNHPYGEYFEGVIDEVRIYERALNSSEVHAEMSAPIGSDRSASERGLVAAYALDAGSGRVASDASGNGNAGTIDGANWTTRARFGRAIRFNGAGDIVRVPASASLNLRGAMTLSAWIRPSESQPGGGRSCIAKPTPTS